MWAAPLCLRFAGVCWVVWMLLGLPLRPGLAFLLHYISTPLGVPGLYHFPRSVFILLLANLFVLDNGTELLSHRLPTDSMPIHAASKMIIDFNVFLHYVAVH